MRTLSLTLVFIILFNCNSDKNSSQGLTELSESTQDSLNFTATFKDKEYKLSVNCSYVLTDYFQFKSDKLDNKDTNGDGIIALGFLHKKKLVVTFVVNGELYSTPKLDIWSKLNGEVHGEGYLYAENSSEKHDFQFQLNCN